MNYYILEKNADGPIIGEYPQVGHRKGYNPRSPKGHYNIRYEEFPNFEPEITLQFTPRAKVTDNVSFSMPSSGLLFNKKTKEIFEQFNLPPHRFYPISVYHKKENTEFTYYWFYFIVSDFWELFISEGSFAQLYVNGPKGWHKVYGEKMPLINREQIIRDEEAYKIPPNLNLGTVKSLKFGNINMKETLLNYDFYELDCLNYHMIISEPLKNAIELAGITGFEIRSFEALQIKKDED